MSQPDAPRRDGLLLLDKPAGPTSFRVVTRARAALARAAGVAIGAVRGGHAGTLDPLATGLLLVLCGAGTRLAPFLVGLDKRYVVRARFGAGTDTDDAEGRVTARRPVAFDPAALAAALDGFRGELAQVPPDYSAIKRDGSPLHRLARAGRPLPALAPRRVVVARLELLATAWGAAAEAAPARGPAPAPEPPAEPPGGPASAPEPPAEPPLAPDGLVYEAELLVDCSSGTYVRALVRDLAAALGSAGHVVALRRLRVGPFVVDDALPGDALEQPAAVAAALRPLDAALPHLPALTLSAEEARAVGHGGQPRPEWLARLAPPEAPEAPSPAAVAPGAAPPDAEAAAGRAGGPAGAWFRMRDERGALVAVGRRDPAGGPPRSVAVFGGEGRR